MQLFLYYGACFVGGAAIGALTAPLGLSVWVTVGLCMIYGIGLSLAYARWLR